MSITHLSIFFYNCLILRTLAKNIFTIFYSYMNILRVSNTDATYNYTHPKQMVQTTNVIKNNPQNISFSGDYKCSPVITNKTILQLVKMGYPNQYLINFVKGHLYSLEQANTLMEIRATAAKKRDTLSSYNHKVNDEELDKLFFEEPHKVLNTVNVLGEKSFISSFNNKFENVKNCINTIGDINPEHPFYQNLLELTNPQQSAKYKNTQEQITNAKKQFQATNDRAKLIKHINYLTDENKNLIKNSITDYSEKIELARFFHTMQNSHEKLGSVLNNYDKHHKNNLLDTLNDVARTDSEGQICRQFDFKNSDYLPKMFTTDEMFKSSYDELLKTLNKKPDKSVREVLLELPQNKETKIEFEKLGINFERWTTFDPKSKLQKTIVTEDKQQKAMQSLEEIFNSPIYTLVSSDKKFLLEKELNSKGYEIKPKFIFLNNFVGTIKRNSGYLKLFKDNKQITFQDMPELIDTIDNFIQNNQSWINLDESKQSNVARKTIEKSIQDVKQKINSAKKNSDSENFTITAQQVDMNNIAHSLFLGNDSSCCMAIGTGSKQSIAPNYIKNKMVSGIEVLVDDKPIGNTICYIAEIDNKTALVLDNIEMKPDYRKGVINDNARDLMFAYAKKFTKELGKENMPIYVGRNRNKINLRDYQIERKDFRIVGTSGEDRIYIDSVVTEGKFDGYNIFNELLHDISNSKRKPNTEKIKNLL